MRSGLLMIGFLLCAGAGLADVSLLAVLAPGHFASPTASPPATPSPVSTPPNRPLVAVEPPEPPPELPNGELPNAEPPAEVPAFDSPTVEVEVVETPEAPCVVYFASESIELDAAGLESLRRFAATVDPAARLRIEGHSDPSGSVSGHAYFSGERARTVLRLLNSFGISRSAMTARGLGAARPLDPHPSPATLAHDRRVEIFIERNSP